MTSARKSEAARVNGAKSRGPKTAAGLAKSSRNALVHGFTSRNILLLKSENPAEFQEMVDDYHATHTPETAAERDLVDQMIAARWRIRRLWTIDTCLLNAEILRRQPKIDRDYSELALAFRSLALISRYEPQLRHMHDRAFTTLRELQQARKNKNARNEPTEIRKFNDQNPLPVKRYPDPPESKPTEPSSVSVPTQSLISENDIFDPGKVA